MYELLKKCNKNKKVMSNIKLIVTLMIILSFSYLKSQTILQQDSLIRILLIKSFPICNPPPQYIVEIKNDMTISFYNNIPENFSKHQAELLGSWIIDSTTILLESTDFIALEKTILGIELQNINNYKKREPSKNGVTMEISGGPSNTYIIETSEKSIKYNIIAIPRNELLDPFNTIRNAIEEIEEKYIPK